MVNPNVSAIMNGGLQAEAIAGASGAIFTAADRKIIKELSGETDKSRSFLEIFKENPLTQKVENDGSKANHEVDVKIIATQQRLYQEKMEAQKEAKPRENSNEKKPEMKRDSYEHENYQPPLAQTKQAQQHIHQQTLALAKELKLNTTELLDKFTLEQKELFHLICKIKELHLKRLLAEKRAEFESLSQAIKIQTLAAAQNEAKPWLANQLDKLTKEAAEYKLGILTSLQAMDFDQHREENVEWLSKTVAQHS